MASTDIVIVNVTVLAAPKPSTLQQTGAFISQGGTTLADNASALLTQVSDLAALLAAPATLSTLTWTGGVATATAAAAHGVPTGDTFITTIAGATQTGYNGTVVATATTTTAFTYSIATTPGTSPATGSPTYTPYGVGELQAMTNTYFAEGASVGVYVLELGAGTAAAGVTALRAYLNSTALRFYRYLLPALWAAESTAPTLARDFSNDTAQVYFHPTLTLSNYSPWLVGTKAVDAFVQDPTAPPTEFSAAAFFEFMLANNPSSTNKLLPASNRYLFGVTQLVNPNTVALKAAGLNYAASASEGGLSNTILRFGTDITGLDVNFWYAGDWYNINCHLALAAAVIVGSNDPVNTLDYDQPGINTLQAVAQGQANRGISYGVGTGAPLVTAVSFAAYTAANPSNFEQGIYGGFALIVTPAKGFQQIIFNLTISMIAPTS